MIGNDVVDLELAKLESNWRRKGFLCKIFTSKEQQFIFDSKQPENMVWDLWSRKESVYKINHRKTGISTYNPLKFECERTDELNGKVIFNKTIFYTQTLQNEEKISTVAVTRLVDFGRIITLDPNFELQKRNSIPYYYDPIRQKIMDVSISHHGRYEHRVLLNL